MLHALIFQMRTCFGLCKVVLGPKGTVCASYKRFLNGIPVWTKLPSLRLATLSFCPLQRGRSVKTSNKMLPCVALFPFRLNTSNHLRAIQHLPISLKAESSHVWAKLWPREGRKMGHNPVEPDSLVTFYEQPHAKITDHNYIQWASSHKRNGAGSLG